MRFSALQLFGKVRHGFGYFDLLRADGLATAAAEAGAGQLVLGHGGEGHGGDEAAAGEAVFVVKFQEARDVQTLRAVADAVVAGRAGPVSYTHLDVYKRQHIFSADWPSRCGHGSFAAPRAYGFDLFRTGSGKRDDVADRGDDVLFVHHFPVVLQPVVSGVAHGRLKIRALSLIHILTAPGVLAGCVLTFVPSIGLFFMSDLLGGANDVFLGNLINDQLLKSRDWPFAAALSVVMMLLTSLFLWLCLLYTSRCV